MKLSSGAKANLKSKIRKREAAYWAVTDVAIFNLTSYGILGTHETMEDTMIEGDRNQKTEEWETAEIERDTYLAFHLLKVPQSASDTGDDAIGKETYDEENACIEF